MTTRREAVILLTLAPWFAGSAQAAEKITSGDLLKLSVEKLTNPVFIRQQYYILRFYVELLRIYPPKNTDKYKYDPKEIYATMTILSRMIFANKKKYSGLAGEIIKEWQADFDQRQPSLQEYLKQVGIEIGEATDKLIENAIFSTVLYYESVTATKKLANLKWCIWPFCYSSLV